MKTWYFFIISVLVIVTIGMSSKLSQASSDSGSLTELYSPSPDLTNMSLSLSDTFEQTSPNSTKDLHLEFFNAKNNTMVKNVSFFINATKDGKVLMYDLFYTKTGSMTIKFSPGSDVRKWTVNGSNDPVLGGWMSENDTLPITTSIFSEEGAYHIHVVVLALVYVNGLVDPSNPPAFDSWWTVDQKGNIAKYSNSTISFGSSTPSFKIKDESPLRQFKSGLSANYITCKKNLYVIVKAENSHPACVDIETGKKLVERGWANDFEMGMTQDSWTTCDRPFSQSGSGTAVLYMPVNWIGKICLRYSNPNDTPETVYPPEVFDPNNSYQNTTNVTIWTYTPVDTIPKGNTTIVAYFIKTGNKTGFYGLSLPSCVTTPFAVGYNDSQITSNDFPFLDKTVSCSIRLYPEIDGTAGIDVKYIPHQ